MSELACRIREEMQVQSTDAPLTATQKRFNNYATATIRTVAAGRTTSVPAADLHAACKAWMLSGQPMSNLIRLIAVLPGIDMKTPPKPGASPARDYQWPHVEKEWATLAATFDAWDPELVPQIIDAIERLAPNREIRRHADLIAAAQREALEGASAATAAAAAPAEAG